MAIIDKIKAKAKADIKHIVLPEGEEIRNVQAAIMIRDQGLAKLTLLGNPAKVKEVAAGADLTGIDIIDPADSDKAPLYGLAPFSQCPTASYSFGEKDGGND